MRYGEKKRPRQADRKTNAESSAYVSRMRNGRVKEIWGNARFSFVVLQKCHGAVFRSSFKLETHDCCFPQTGEYLHFEPCGRVDTRHIAIRLMSLVTRASMMDWR